MQAKQGKNSVVEVFIKEGKLKLPRPINIEKIGPNPSKWSALEKLEVLEHFSVRRHLVLVDDFIFDPYTSPGDPLANLRVSEFIENNVRKSERTARWYGCICDFLDIIASVNFEEYDLTKEKCCDDLIKKLNEVHAVIDDKIDAGEEKFAFLWAKQFLDCLPVYTTRQNENYYKTVFHTFSSIIACIAGKTVQVSACEEMYTTKIVKPNSNRSFHITAKPDVVFFEANESISHKQAIFGQNKILAVVEVKQDPRFLQIGDGFRRGSSSKRPRASLNEAVHETSPNPAAGADNTSYEEELYNINIYVLKEGTAQCADDISSASNSPMSTTDDVALPSTINEEPVSAGQVPQSEEQLEEKEEYHMCLLKQKIEDGKVIYRNSNSGSDSDSGSMKLMMAEIDLKKCIYLTQAEKDYNAKFLPQLLGEIFASFENYSAAFPFQLKKFHYRNKTLRYGLGVIGFKVTFVTVVIVNVNMEAVQDFKPTPKDFPSAHASNKELRTDVFVTRQYDLLRHSDRKRLADILVTLLMLRQLG